MKPRWTARATGTLCVGTLCLGALRLTAGAARAEPARPASLSWVRLPGAEACIGARALAEAVELRLRRAALVPMSRAEVSIEGRIAAAPEAPRWRVELVVADAKGISLGSRQISSDALDCHALDTELALTVALLVDPEAVLPASPPAPAVPAGSPPTSPSSTSTPPPADTPRPTGTLASRRGDEPAPAAIPASTWGVAFVAGPALSIGLLPSASGGAQIRAIVSPPRFWPLQLGGVVWAPSAAGVGDAAATFFFAAGSLSACPLHVTSGAWRALACAGVAAGEVRTGGFGFDRTHTYSEPVVQAAVEGRVLRRLWGPLTATAGLALVVPFMRTRFYSRDAEGTEREVFLASAVAGSADLSLGVELP